jgi:L-lactate dehydrogenase
VGGVSLLEFARQIDQPITKAVRSEIEDGVRKAAGRIIEGKGATYHGIGGGLSRIVRAIRDDEGVVLSVSSRSRRMKEFTGICFSVPRIVGREGIVAELWPSLSDQEYDALEQSTSVISEAVEKLGY